MSTKRAAIHAPYYHRRLASAFFAVNPLSAQPQAPSAENLAAARELVLAMKATDQFKALFPLILDSNPPSYKISQGWIRNLTQSYPPFLRSGCAG
jgi:hypothetical protein